MRVAGQAGQMRVAGQAGQMRVANQVGQMVCYHYQQPRHMTGLPSETGIPGFWDITVPVSSRTGEDTIHSSTTRYRPEGSVSVSGSYTGTPHFTGRPEMLEYG